jgi:hypothetical protein
MLTRRFQHLPALAVLAVAAACTPAAPPGVGPGAPAQAGFFPDDLPGRFEVVGRGPVTHTHTSELWVFRGVDGRDYAYTGTWGACRGCVGDRVYAWDVTDPANPVLTDSVVVDARVINDVMVRADSRVAVLTREGASSRRNGIVILDLAEPAHPRVLSEFSETLTGGVHVIYVDGDHVYATNNGTGDMHVISIEDPANPRQVARWGVRTPGRYLHDVWVDNGLAYLSYWDDGLIILDVGNGIRNGSPNRPQLVSQLTYRTRWRGRSYGNTHQALPYTNSDGHSYIFVGDEIFPDDSFHRRADFVPGGYIHVVDASDLTNPRIVGRYEVPNAGAHNLWAHDDKLYIAYYNAGLRVIDVSGQLEGDLRAQGREIAVLPTIDEDAFLTNRPFTWSPRLHNGLVFVSDMNSGLWITRLVYPVRGAGSEHDEVQPR